MLMINVNALLDKGEVLDPEDVHQAIREERLLHFLSDRFPTDLSLFENGEDVAALNEILSRIEGALDAERKFGVSRNGLALIMAYCITALQMSRDEVA